MLSKLHRWLKDLLAPGWDSSKPEIEIIVDFKNLTWRIDMDSFRNSKEVRRQLDACKQYRHGGSSETTCKSQRKRPTRVKRNGNRNCVSTLIGL